MQIDMRVTAKEILALILVGIGFCTAVAVMWPILSAGKPADLRQLRVFVPVSLMFLGAGCGIVTRHPLTYLVAIAGATSFVMLNV